MLGCFFALMGFFSWVLMDVDSVRRCLAYLYWLYCVCFEFSCKPVSLSPVPHVIMSSSWAGICFWFAFRVGSWRGASVSVCVLYVSLVSPGNTTIIMVWNGSSTPTPMRVLCVAPIWVDVGLTDVQLR